MEHLGNLLPPGPAERLEEELHVARGLLPLPPRRTKQMTNHNNLFTPQGANYTSSSGSTPTYTHARPVEIPPRTVPRKFGSDTVLVVDGSAGREKVPFVYSV